MLMNLVLATSKPYRTVLLLDKLLIFRFFWSLNYEMDRIIASDIDFNYNDVFR